eukprot:CAMPEP_0182884652 /NCGR_PEP_ID=MMETSP0034_2-20130328/19131_1 /TAXON_ID=156128 /ORGANISM="Nephroselmis pyriformis, Strain CCMP717" /LENGTH=182 /DNA_ID=CAMNT_0025017869 /DNA_START=132 /DNA_END=681 /DNA_ORIENTATION=-
MRGCRAHTAPRRQSTRRRHKLRARVAVQALSEAVDGRAGGAGGIAPLQRPDVLAGQQHGCGRGSAVHRGRKVPLEVLRKDDYENLESEHDEGEELRHSPPPEAAPSPELEVLEYQRGRLRGELAPQAVLPPEELVSLLEEGREPVVGVELQAPGHLQLPLESDKGGRGAESVLLVRPELGEL